jgi:agmatinase
MGDFQTRLDGLESGMVAVLGVPSDFQSSFRRGPADAPAKIRETLYSDMTNMCAENGVDLRTENSWKDLGDLDLENGDGDFARIEESVADVLSQGGRVVSLGGDHSITHPILRAQAKRFPKLNILHLDAHPDLYDELHGNRNSHGCPFARIMEESLAERLVQVGIRTLTPHLREQAKRFGVEIIEMREWSPGRRLTFEGPVYLSIDIDAIDPAFAPGVSHPEPGGLTSRDVVGLIQGFEGRLVGADIVEYNPDRDSMGITAALGAKLLKEVTARMVEEGSPRGR